MFDYRPHLVFDNDTEWLWIDDHTKRLLSLGELTQLINKISYDEIFTAWDTVKNFKENRLVHSPIWYLIQLYKLKKTIVSVEEAFNNSIISELFHYLSWSAYSHDLELKNDMVDCLYEGIYCNLYDSQETSTHECLKEIINQIEPWRYGDEYCELLSWHHFLYNDRSLIDSNFRMREFKDAYKAAYRQLDYIKRLIGELIHLKTVIPDFLETRKLNVYNDITSSFIDRLGLQYASRDNHFTSFAVAVALEQDYLLKQNYYINICEECGEVYYDTLKYTTKCAKHRTLAEQKKWKRKVNDERRYSKLSTIEKMREDASESVKKWIRDQKAWLKENNTPSDIYDDLVAELDAYYQSWFGHGTEVEKKNNKIDAFLIANGCAPNPKINELEMKYALKFGDVRDRAPKYYSYRYGTDYKIS